MKGISKQTLLEHSQPLRNRMADIAAPPVTSAGVGWPSIPSGVHPTLRGVENPKCPQAHLLLARALLPRKQAAKTS